MIASTVVGAGVTLVLVAVADMSAGWSVETLRDALRETALAVGCVDPRVSITIGGRTKPVAEISVYCTKRRERSQPNLFYPEDGGTGP